MSCLDGRVLVCLAKRGDDGRMRPHPHIFPGVKVMKDEGTMEKVDQLIATLAPLSAGVKVESTWQGEEDKESGSKGIVTRYVCTYVNASLDPLHQYAVTTVRKGLSLRDSKDSTFVGAADIFLLTRGDRLYAWVTQGQAQYMSKHFSELRTSVAEVILGLDTDVWL